METFIVPMFAVITAKDDPDLFRQIDAMQEAARRTGCGYLYQDEGIPERKVPGDVDYHSILDFYTTEELIR